MIDVRHAEERGHADHGWLDSRHTFSFADYHDPRHMGFRDLRVINEDRVAPGRASPRTATGTWRSSPTCSRGRWRTRTASAPARCIRPGDVQRMSAGTGVAAQRVQRVAERARALPADLDRAGPVGIAPGYEQKAFAEAEARARCGWSPRPTGAEGSLTIHQDARLYATVLAPGQAGAIIPSNEGAMRGSR